MNERYHKKKNAILPFFEKSLNARILKITYFSGKMHFKVTVASFYLYVHFLSRDVGHASKLRVIKGYYALSVLKRKIKLVAVNKEKHKNIFMLF